KVEDGMRDRNETGVQTCALALSWLAAIAKPVRSRGGGGAGEGALWTRPGDGTWLMYLLRVTDEATKVPPEASGRHLCSPLWADIALDVRVEPPIPVPHRTRAGPGENPRPGPGPASTPLQRSSMASA